MRKKGRRRIGKKSKEFEHKEEKRPLMDDQKKGALRATD